MVPVIVFMVSAIAMHFVPWQTCSVKHQLGFARKHPAMLQLMHEDYSYTGIHPPLSKVTN